MKPKNDNYRKIFLSISIVSLVLILFVGSFSIYFLNKEYYEKLYEKTGTYGRIDKGLAINKTEELFLFFENKSSLDLNFYTKNEISHLNDVKNLVKKIFTVYYISLFLLLISIIIVYIYLKVDISLFTSKVLFYSGIVIIVIILLASLLLLLNFSGLFESFHQTFFNGNYSFPDSSNMLKLFNEEFFRLFAIKIFLITLLKGIVVSFAGGLLIFRYKKKNKLLSLDK